MTPLVDTPTRRSPSGGQFRRPFIVGLGGTMRNGSSTELVLRAALERVQDLGADTEFLGADRINLPMYSPERSERTREARELVEVLRRADGMIVGSPGYHGGISGLVKNALDYIEDMRNDTRPYLDGIAVGTIVCAHGWQATTMTLAGLRAVIHALRGWPTPLGVAVNAAEPFLDANGKPLERLEKQLEILASQVVQHARMRIAGSEYIAL